MRAEAAAIQQFTPISPIAMSEPRDLLGVVVPWYIILIATQRLLDPTGITMYGSTGIQFFVQYSTILVVPVV